MPVADARQRRRIGRRRGGARLRHARLTGPSGALDSGAASDTGPSVADNGGSGNDVRGSELVEPNLVAVTLTERALARLARAGYGGRIRSDRDRPLAPRRTK